MGDEADYLINRMMDDGISPYSCGRRSRKKKHREPKKPVDPGAFDEETRAREFPSKKTDPRLLPDYPEKTFDMGFFPTIPKKEPPKPQGWDVDEEEAPF